MRLYGLVSLILAAAVLIFAGTAAAQTFDCNKQEGVAVSDQYCPSQPPSGPDPTAPPKAPVREELPTRVVDKLEREGDAGKALLDLPRVAPADVVRAQTGGRAKRVVDAERLLAIGALGTPITPESAAKILAKTATLGEGFAKTFRWGLLVTTFLLVGASWLRYRSRGGAG